MAVKNSLLPTVRIDRT